MKSINDRDDMFFILTAEMQGNSCVFLDSAQTLININQNQPIYLYKKYFVGTNDI